MRAVTVEVSSLVLPDSPTGGKRAGLTLRGFLLRPFILPFLLLAGVGLAVLVGVRGNERSLQQVTDSQSRLILLGSLSNDISDLENGERGYVISGKEEFRTPYTDAQGAFQVHVFALHDLSADARQSEGLAQLQALVLRWQAEAAEPEMNARQRGLQDAVELVSNGKGRELLNQARKVLDAMQIDENNRLSGANEASTATLRTVSSVTIAGLLLSVALLVFTAWRVAHTLAGSVTQVTRGAQEIAQGDYHLRLPDAPVRELSALSAQFNRMAGAVQERQDALQTSNTQLERSNRELEQFAYVASHDLQEPLRTISSYTELLARRYQGQLDTRADQYIAFTTQATARMKHLIQDLLAFSRVRQGTRTFAPVDVQALMNEVQADLHAQISETGAMIKVQPLPTLTANADLLRHVLQNLLGNALKFRRPEQPPAVQISCTRELGRWVFHVQDNGIGIEPQYYDRIFGVFQRLHTTDEYSGSGIGLAVTRSAIEQHGGELWVTSTPGQGSTFHFSLPDQPGPTAQVTETVPA